MPIIKQKLWWNLIMTTFSIKIFLDKCCNHVLINIGEYIEYDKMVSLHIVIALLSPVFAPKEDMKTCTLLYWLSPSSNV